MLWSLFLLIAFHLLGELLQIGLGVPLPGTVIGLGLLLASLGLYGRSGRAVSLPTADHLLPYLALLLVPPGVDAALRLLDVAAAWMVIVPAILGSSVLALSVSGWIGQSLLKRQDRGVAGHASSPLPLDAKS